MKIKRTISFFSALLLSLSSLFVISIPHALAASVTWDGEGADDNFSTATNWVGDVVPSNGDDLVFDNSSFSSTLTVNNDLTGASFNSITLQGSTAWDVIINGSAFTITGGMTVSADTSLEVNSDITISGSQSVTMPADGAINVDGMMSGSGNLTKAGAGDLRLRGNNISYTGAITVSAGLLAFNDVNALGATSAGTTVASGATLGFYGFSSDTTITEPLTLSGNTTTEAIALAQSFWVGAGAASLPYPTATFSGAITLQSNIIVELFDKNIKLTGSCSGSYTMSVKSGSTGTLNVASSPNNCLTSGIQETAAKTTEYKDSSPSTNIIVTNKETAIVTGTYGSVTVGSGGTLKGTGTVGTIYVDNLGKLAPGLSPGCINSGNLTFVSGSTYEFEVGGTTACSGYDQTKVTGTVDLGNGTLSTVLYGGFRPAVNQSYTIIDNDGSDAATGTFANLAEGATFTVSGYVFKISYIGGTGNDVTLTVQAVPATPNTGFELITNNPFVTLVAMSTLAGGMVLIARRYSKLTAK